MPRNARLPEAATIAALLIVCAVPSLAQGPAASPDTGDAGLPTLMLRGPSTYGAWVAAAHHSQFRTRTGVPGHRDFYLMNVRFGWGIGDQTRPVSVAYFIDVIPAA